MRSGGGGGGGILKGSGGFEDFRSAGIGDLEGVSPSDEGGFGGSPPSKYSKAIRKLSKPPGGTVWGKLFGEGQPGSAGSA